MALRTLEKSFFIHKGINDQSTLKRIEDDHLFENTNFDYIPAANGKVQVEMRSGVSNDTMSTNLSGGGAVLGIESVDFTAGNEVVFVVGDRIYQLAATPTLLISGVTAAIHDFSMLEDRLIIANGTDVLLEKAKGSDPTTLGGTPPVAKYLHQWHNFIWGAGMSANPNRLQGCELGNKDVWPAANIHDRPHGLITGIGNLRDVLYIFHLNKIEKLSGYSTSTFTFKDFADTGCISQHSIVSNGTTLFFISRDGPYAIGAIGSTDKLVGGTSLIKLADQKIRTFWDTLDVSSRDLFHGVHDRDNHRILWSVRRSGESDNDRILFFDYHSSVLGFGFMDGIYANCFTLGRNSSTGKYEVKYGESRTDANGGIINFFDSSANNDLGVKITATIQAKAYDFGDPEKDKRWLSVSPLVKGGASETPVDVFYGAGEFPDYTNQKQFLTSSLPLYGTAIYGVDKYTQDTFKNYPIAIRKMGKALVLKITTNTLNKRVKIAGWKITAQPLTRKVETKI